MKHSRLLAGGLAGGEISPHSREGSAMAIAKKHDNLFPAAVLLYIEQRRRSGVAP